MPQLPRINSVETVTPELPTSVYVDADSSFESVHQNSYLAINSPLNLKQYAQRQLCKQVDFFNAIQMLVFAERTFSDELASFTAEFILMNLDAVLVHARPKDLAYLLDDFLSSWEKLASFKKISSRSTEKYHAKYHPSKVSASHDDSVKKRSDSLDECNLRERTKSADLESYSSALKAIKSIRKKLNSVREIEVAKQKGTVLTPEQLEKLKRKAPLEYELRRLEPILKRLESEENIRQAAQLRRCIGLSGVDEVQVSRPYPGHRAGAAEEQGSPSVPALSPATTMVVPEEIINPGASSASSTNLPTFNEWSTVSATANNISSNQRKTAWKVVPTSASVVVAENVSKFDSPAKLTVPRGNLNSHSAYYSPPGDSGLLTLAAFLTPPASKRLAKEWDSNGSRGWNKGFNTKSPISLQKIQQEEETIRSNSSLGNLKGNNSPWFIERSLRPDSFGDIIESQRRQSDQELIERRALIAAEAAANRMMGKKSKSRKPSKTLKKN